MALGLKLFRHAVPAGLSQIPRIPPTSNQAERDLRPAKTQQKISGRLRSQARAGNRYAIRGALTGNPWMPPLPA